MAERRPGKGLFGWLGRQVGYVTRAVKADIGSRRIYRQQNVQEQMLPNRPDVKLRRTTIDEVIVKQRDQRKSE